MFNRNGQDLGSVLASDDSESEKPKPKARPKSEPKPESVPSKAGESKDSPASTK